MPKKGFSYRDYLNPQPREYNEDLMRRPYDYDEPPIGRAMAKKILESLCLDTIPIDLDPICRHLLARVVHVEREPENNSAIGRFVGNGLIEIIEGLPENLRRSTLAHELGHLALNHDVKSKWDALNSLYDHSAFEREAWDFAGSLLIPDSALRKHFTKKTNAEYLSRLFEVSKDFISVELLKRGYLDS